MPLGSAHTLFHSSLLLFQRSLCAHHCLSAVQLPSRAFAFLSGCVPRVTNPLPSIRLANSRRFSLSTPGVPHRTHSPMALEYSQLGTALPSHLSLLSEEPGKVCGLQEGPNGDKVKWGVSGAHRWRLEMEGGGRRGLVTPQEEMVACPSFLPLLAKYFSYLRPQSVSSPSFKSPCPPHPSWRGQAFPAERAGREEQGHFLHRVIPSV